jgi:M-phase inducer tyrosine phosphatase
MERSSPLAALRPAPPQFGGQKDLFRSRAQSHFTTNYSSNTTATGTFNFSLREQFSLNHPEYFSLKTFGSSPTVSLAADLSQNFSITEARYVATGQVLSPRSPWQMLTKSCSPHFPTPRRALFTTSHLIDGSDGRGKNTLVHEDVLVTGIDVWKQCRICHDPSASAIVVSGPWAHG